MPCRLGRGRGRRSRHATLAGRAHAQAELDREAASWAALWEENGDYRADARLLGTCLPPRMLVDALRAATLDEVVAEIAATRITERGETRADDRVTEAAMEDRKREGYF